MATKSPYSNALPEIPLELIKEAEGQYPRCKVVLRCQTVKGTWSSRPMTEIDTHDLGTIDEWIRKEHGGGRYRVSARDIDNELNEIVPPFHVEIEGPRKHPEADRPRPFGPRPNGYGIPSFAQREQARAHSGDADDARLDPSDFMTMTPDAIAMEVARNLRAELKETREAERIAREADQKRSDREREERHKAERERDAADRKHEKELMDLRLEMVKTQQTPRPSIDFVGLATAFAPIAVAVISAGTSKQSTALTAQQEAAKLQSEQMKEIFLQISKKPDNSGMMDVLKVSLPVLSPLLMKFFEERSPGAAAKLMNAMAEGQLETISMMSQLMQQMQPDNDNPWIEVGTKVLQGIENVVGQMVELNRPKQGRALPQNSAAARMTGGGNGAGRTQQPSQKPAQQPAQKPGLTAASAPHEFAEAIVNAPNVPEAFKSDAWYEVFSQLHNVKLDPVEVARALVHHLEDLADTGALPELLGAALDADKNPSDTLRPFLEQLPLAQLAPDRIGLICQAADQILSAAVVDVPAQPVGAPATSGGQVFSQA